MNSSPDYRHWMFSGRHGTLHSFCLNCVLRPFSHLLQDSGPFSLDIGAEDVTSPLLAAFRRKSYV